MATKLKYPLEYYRASAALSAQPLNRQQMEREYERLASRARKNLARIKESEFAADLAYKNLYGKFDKSGADLSDRELAYMLQEVAGFVTSARSSYTGAREARRKAVRSLKQSGYDFITYKNFPVFAEFMDAVKTAYGDHLYDSNRVVEFFEEQEQTRVSPMELLADFNAWLADQKIKV